MDVRNIASAFFCSSFLGSDPYLGRRLMSWAKTTCGTKSPARRSARRTVRKISIETPNIYYVELAITSLLADTEATLDIIPAADITVWNYAHTARAYRRLRCDHSNYHRH